MNKPVGNIKAIVIHMLLLIQKMEEGGAASADCGLFDCSICGVPANQLEDSVKLTLVKGGNAGDDGTD